MDTKNHTIWHNKTQHVSCHVDENMKNVQYSLHDR